MDSSIATTELLNITTGVWYTCNDLPVPHTHFMAVVLNNTLYLLGGYDIVEDKPSL